MERLAKIKLLLGIKDDLQDELLAVIDEMAVSGFLAYVGDKTYNDAMDNVIVELVVERYNRIGSEGIASQTIDGVALAFENSDYSRFNKQIQLYYPEFKAWGVKFL